MTPDESESAGRFSSKSPEVAGFISHCVRDCLREYARQDDSGIVKDPEALLRCKSRVLSSCIAKLITFRLSKLGKFHFSPPIAKHVQSLTPFERARVRIFQSQIRALPWRNSGLLDVYDILHSTTHSVDEQGIKLSKGTSARNGIGAYYTPNNLAAKCVSETLDSYIESRTGIPRPLSGMEKFNGSQRRAVLACLTNLTIADLSCGGGRFLLATCRKLFAIYSQLGQILPRRAIVKKMFGADIDYLAVEICVAELCLFAEDLDVSEHLRKQLVHANPLVRPMERPASSLERADLYDLGLHYSPRFGLGLEELPKAFEIVVGNPPWEKVRLEEREFFHGFAPRLSRISKKDMRTAAIGRLNHSAPALFRHFVLRKEVNDAFIFAVRRDARFQFTARGEINTYALFTELCLHMMAPSGRVGILTKSAIATAPVNSSFFKMLMEKKLLLSMWDFTNIRRIFPIDNRERFCLLLMGHSHTRSFSVRMGLTEPEQISQCKRPLRLNPGILTLINPATSMLPNVRGDAELDFLVKIAASNPPLASVYGSAKFGRVVHYTNHARHISRSPGPANVPIYEGKFIGRYDGKFSGYNSMSQSMRYRSKARAVALNPTTKWQTSVIPESRYFIASDAWRQLSRRFRQNYSLMWRSLTSATNTQPCIATILPHMPTSQSIVFLQLQNESDLAILLAVFNSQIFNTIVRLKLNGIDLTQGLVKQLPVPPLSRYAKTMKFGGNSMTLGQHIVARVHSLLVRDHRLGGFCRNLQQAVPASMPSTQVADTVRELDELVARAYGLTRSSFEDAKTPAFASRVPVIP